MAAKGRQIETEAAPIRYVAELLGTDTDSEKAIRWLIALMVLCCDHRIDGRGVSAEVTLQEVRSGTRPAGQVFRRRRQTGPSSAAPRMGK